MQARGILVEREMCRTHVRRGGSGCEDRGSMCEKTAKEGEHVRGDCETMSEKVLPESTCARRQWGRGHYVREDCQEGCTVYEETAKKRPLCAGRL